MGRPGRGWPLARELVLVERLLIQSDSQLDAALDGLEPPIAIDTEFHSEHRYYPRLMLIQLCDAAGRVVLIDARAPLTLTRLSALDGAPLIAHAPSQDLALLARHAGLQPGLVSDVQTLAGFCGLGYPRTLGDLSRELLGTPPVATATLSDWRRRPLDEHQLRYAIADVSALHRIAAALEERLGHRRAWAHEACAELVRDALSEAPVEDAYARIGAVSVLSPIALDALRRLATWRETEARAQDQPPWQIASDAILVDLARRRPTSVEAMRTNRRFPKRVATKHADVVLRLCAEASGDDRFDQQARARLDAMERLLDAWAADFELRRGIAARLSFSAQERRKIAISALARAPIALSGWRDQALSPELSPIVTGVKSLKSHLLES